MSEPASTPSVPIATTNSAADTSANSSGVNGTLQNAKESIVSGAQSVASSIQNNETIKSLGNGPVAENVKDQAAKTSAEFQILANSRATPQQPAATGQTLTHYHSFFYNLLSWKNPRATSAAFASTVLFIFAARFVPILKWTFKAAYIVLGSTALMEIAGKYAFDDGLASKFRPRNYYTIPRESLEASLEDVEQLINFFVIETQRVVFAENVYVTLAVFLSAFISYWLIKLVPFWGLAVIGTVVLYATPLIYVTNKETIDSALNRTGEMLNNQTSQLKDITAQHANNMTQSVKGITSEYTSKAQEFVNARRPGQPNGPKVEPESPPSYSENSFPSAPKTEPLEKPDAVIEAAAAT